MQTTNFQDVQAFFEKFEVPKASKPQLLDAETFAFRLGHLEEELAELSYSQKHGDLEGVADALVDLVYLAMGTAIAMGLPWEKLWAEVQRANMSKVRAKSKEESKRGSALDVIKPEGWVGPNHHRALYLEDV